MGCVSDSDFDLLLAKRFGGRSLDSAFISDVDYKYNQCQLKHYFDSGGNSKYKLVFMSALKTKGVEEEDRIKQEGYENSEKFDQSLIRAKSKIYDLAFCNSWEYFFTGTLDPLKYDRSDLDLFHKDFTQWIRNYNRLHKCCIKFLIVPELHNDNKSWHFHGFIMGLPIDCLVKYCREDFYPYTDVRLPRKLLKELDNGYDVFSWGAYQIKFGWCTLEPIKDHNAVSGYVTKYITKDVLKSVSDVGAHTYFRSRGLQEPIIEYSGNMDMTLLNSLDFSMENQYCKVAWIEENDINFIKEVLSNANNYQS